MVPRCPDQGEAGRERSSPRNHGHPAERLRDLGADAGGDRRADQGRRSTERLLPVADPDELLRARGRACRGIQSRACRRDAWRRQGADRAAGDPSDKRSRHRRIHGQVGRQLPRSPAASQSVGQCRPVGATAANLLAHHGVSVAGRPHRARHGSRRATYARRILHDVYLDFMRSVLAMPVIVGRKTAKERFAGAENTMTCEGIMRDGKALQMATSHELGQRFSRAFNISYSSAEGATELCWTTSWGASTRMLGGLIMCHGDDFGLVLPPALAPVQVVVVVVKDTDGAVTRAASALVDELKARGVRVSLDDNVAQAFGWRATDWDLQGVPIRVELGPRDLAENAVLLYRRDTRDKTKVGIDNVVDEAQQLTGRIQMDMFEAATARRDASISDCTTPRPGSRCSADGRRPLALGVGRHRRRTGPRHQRPDGAVPATQRRIAARNRSRRGCARLCCPRLLSCLWLPDN